MIWENVIFTNLNVEFILNNVDIDGIMVSNKVSFCKKGFEHFVGYQRDDEIKPLCVMLQTIHGYTKSFNETNSMSFFIEESIQFMKAYNKVWDKVSDVIKKGFNSKPL